MDYKSMIRTNLHIIINLAQDCLRANKIDSVFTDKIKDIDDFARLSIKHIETLKKENKND